MDIIELQKTLESLKYPPTQNYEIQGLKPDNFLKDRIEKINKISPEFFKGNNFLDIGAGKGFFSFYADNKFNSIIGIEPRKDYFDFCQEAVKTLKIKNVKFECCSFKNFYPSKLFDRVFIGNCMHYLYQARNSKEKEGWTWVYKLASLMTAGGILIIESPLNGKENPDIGYLAGDEDYSKPTFLKTFAPFFDVLDIVNSPSKYRYIIKLRRKSNPIQNKYNYENFKQEKRLDYREGRETFVTSDGNVCKIFQTKPSYSFLIQTTAISYFSTRASMKGVVIKGGIIVGIVQEYLGDSRVKDLNKAWDLYQCDQKLSLKLGYIDVDWGVVNIVANKIVDVSSICLVSNLLSGSKDAFSRNIKRDYLEYIGKEKCNNKIELVNNLR